MKVIITEYRKLLPSLKLLGKDMNLLHRKMKNELHLRVVRGTRLDFFPKSIFSLPKGNLYIT